MRIDVQEKIKLINKYIYVYARSLSDEAIVGIKSDLVILQDTLNID